MLQNAPIPRSQRSLYADFDFPLLKSDARMQEEILEKSTVIIPYYRYSSDVVDASEKRLAEIYLDSFAAPNSSTRAV